MPERSSIDRRLRGVRQLALFMLVPGLAATSSLVAVPAVTSRFGAEGWATVAVGLAVGSTGAAFADLGWSIIGPQMVARSSDGGRLVYERCLGTKLAALVVLLPASGLLAAMLSPSHTAGAVLIALGSLLGVLTPSWFFVGTNRPGSIMVTETIPRLVVAFASGGAVFLGAPIEVYGAGVLFSSVLVFVLGSLVGGLPALPSLHVLRSAPSTIWQQRTVILGNIVSTVFTSAPAALLAAVSTSALTIATYSAVDRPLRMGLSILGGVPSRLQSWVGIADRAEARRRSTLSLWANCALGALAFLVFFLLAPSVTAFLFSGSVTVSFFYSFLGGVLAALICASRGVGLALVSEDRPQAISAATYVGAAVGLPLLILLPPIAGAAGALLAVICAEVAMIGVQAVLLFRMRGSGDRQWSTAALPGRVVPE